MRTLNIEDITLSGTDYLKTAEINTANTYEAFKIGDIFLIEEVYFKIKERKIKRCVDDPVNIYKLKSILPRDISDDFLNINLLNKKLELIEDKETIKRVKQEMCYC